MSELVTARVNTELPGGNERVIRPNKQESLEYCFNGVTIYFSIILE